MIGDKFNPIIYPADTYPSAAAMFTDVVRMLLEPGMSNVLGGIKFNDGLHYPDMTGPMVVRGIRTVGEMLKIRLGVFVDGKWGDVKDTLKNDAGHYKDCQPDILTVSEKCSAEGFLTLLQEFPETELAFFDVGTDITEEECLVRWKMSPAEKIYTDVCLLEEEFYRVRGANDPELPFHLIVCSPRELDYLCENKLNERYSFVTPAIRDEWMLKDHQKRITGIRYALEKGSKYVPMGRQLRAGNPKKGISPEESRRLTAEEIKKANIPNFALAKGVRLVLKNGNGK